MKTSLLVAVSALSLTWGDAAFAHGVVPSRAVPDGLNAITLDVPIENALGNQDSRTSGPDAIVYTDYRLNLRQGQSVRIDLTSNDFDAYLELYRGGQKLGDPLVSDDDGGPEGTNSRLKFTADQAGEYVVRVRPFMGVEGGSYRLSVVEPVARDYPAGTALVIDRPVTGRLAADSVLDDDEARYVPYTWTGREGERMALRMESGDFDSFISIGKIENGHYVELAQNDDGQIRTRRTVDSYLIFTAPSAGTYYIMAKSVDGQAEGGFTLVMEEGPKAAEVRAITLDQPVEGSLTATTGTGFGNARADQYRFRGEAGQRIVASLESDDFDTFLELYDGQGQSVASDDDGGGDLNSRLVHTLPSAGAYTLEARALSSATGDYELTLKVLPVPPQPQTIRFGQTIEGELKSTAAVDNDGHYYVGYSFEGRKDQRIQFTMRSGDFDAMTEIGLMPQDGEAFKVLQSDDDGLRQGTDSRLNFTLPEDGRYEVHALGLDGEATGLFSVELVDRGREPGPGSMLIPSVARGNLNDFASLNDEGQSYDAYEFKAKGDEKLRFTLISAAFDAVVEVGEMKEDSWRSSATDDDSLSDNHARLDWSAPRDGTYQVRVRGYRPGSSGSYSLMVERQP